MKGSFFFKAMILILKNQTNLITLTLTEKCTLVAPKFLFSFFNFISKETINIILADTSLFKERYNRFTFIEPTTDSFTEGFWEYKVYEQVSNSNTDPLLATTLVESGKMKVVDLLTPTAGSTYNGQGNNSSIYQ